MKFPKKLSPERLSLLNPMDLYIYEQEHPEEFGKPAVSSINENVDEDVPLFTEEYDIFDDSEKQSVQENVDNSDEIDYVKEFVESVINESLDELFADFMNEVDSETFENMKNCSETSLLTEEEDFTIEDELKEADNLLLEGAEGYDCGEWVRGITKPLGIFGKIIGASLGALGMGLGYLITVGKDKLAMNKLKRYMNKLVEIIDQGRNKKKPWYSFLLTKKRRDNTGEHNAVSFRFYQEAADRNMCVTVMSAAHKLGFFGDNNMMNISSGSQPLPGSGLDAFNRNVISQLNIMYTEKKEKE